MRGRLLSAVVLLALLSATFLPRGALAEPADWPIPGGQFFTQTSPTAGTGYSVTNANNVPLYRTYQDWGGPDTLGYPLSQRLNWNGRVIQVFQLGVLQYDPRAQQFGLLNVLDMLHDKGLDDWLAARGVPKPLGPEFDRGKTPDQVVELRQSLLAQSPAIQAAYFAIPEPVGLYGLPTSELTDQGTHWAIRTQRTVFQEWKQDTDSVKAGQVTVVNVGELVRDSGLVGGPQVYRPIAAPAPAPPPTPTPTPAPEFNLSMIPDLASLPAGPHWSYVSLSEQTATAMVGDTPVFVARVTTGKPGFPTPRGTFHILRRVYSETMDSLTIGLPRDAPEGYYLKDILFTQYFDNSGDAFHLNYWQPDSVFGNVRTSHGCVGMKYAEAEFYWNFLTVGSTIVIGD